ncbi:MAG: sodium:alanine symporter family protein [Deltaproteobacteria bacterium]|nr:sodium:alanine symporter family protein [Deltaproteobacteria bacterium]
MRVQGLIGPCIFSFARKACNGWSWKLVDTIADFLTSIKNLLWSGPLLLLLLLTGVWLTVRLRGLQFRYLGHALALLFRPGCREEEGGAKQPGELSSFQSLMTALAGAVGTGNITGIAVAITLGGYGSLFWMWLVALFGMMTAYAECLLSVRYREIDSQGGVQGGPMVTLRQGLGMTRTSALFAILCSLAAFGIGATVQSNSVASGFREVFGVPAWGSGMAMMLLTAVVVLGGVQSIGRVAGLLVPFMALLYLGAGSLVVLAHMDAVLPAFRLILLGAFSEQAVTGGIAGAGALAAIQHGVANGVFANEAGLGSLPIAAASARTGEPARQGMLAICGVFLGTMVVCTVTGLVLAVTLIDGGVPDPSQVTGSVLTIMAFRSVHPFLEYVVVFGMAMFAFTTTLAWACYAEKCIAFLLGSLAVKVYRFIYVLAVFAGAVTDTHMIWVLANLANGCMAFPNLISVLRLTDVVISETRHYQKTLELDSGGKNRG